MKLTVNTNHLALIDRVVETGILGKSRGDVLKGAVIEHVRFLLAGGTPFRTGPPGFVEVDTPTYGAVRDEQSIHCRMDAGKRMLRIVGELLHPIAQLRGMHTNVLRCLRIRHAALLDQAHSLKLELACELPPLHDSTTSGKTS
jgi:hypothetical protein